MSSENLCKICESAEFKYSCPKCNIVYCSVACYKSELHINCSEEFFKTCVEAELTLRSEENNGKDDLKKIYDILQRVNDENKEEDFEYFLNGDNDEEGEEPDSDDEALDDDITIRLEGIDINNPNEIWKHLNDEERMEFEKLVENGNILKLLPSFEPWWIKNKPKLVEEIKNDTTDKVCGIPEIKTDIVSFESISKKAPSPCLHHNLCNILTSYTCTVRYFNGEHLITPLEASNYLVTISSALRGKANFDNFETAVQSIAEEAEAEGLAITLEDYNQIRNDVKTLVNGKNGYFQMSALSDVYSLLKLTKDWKFKGNVKVGGGEFSKKFPDLKVNNLTKVQLNQYIKKIEFFLSYVKYRTSE